MKIARVPGLVGTRIVDTEKYLRTEHLGIKVFNKPMDLDFRLVEILNLDNSAVCIPLIFRLLSPEYGVRTVDRSHLLPLELFHYIAGTRRN